MTARWDHLRPRRPGAGEGKRRPRLSVERIAGLGEMCLVAAEHYVRAGHAPPPDVMRAMRYVYDLRVWWEEQHAAGDRSEAQERAEG